MLTIKLNENTNSGMLYAIAYCEDPDIYSEDFWGWDTESDVGYELMEFGSLIQDADVFDSLEAAEDRADDVLSSIFENEVFIVGLDPYTPHNLTGFVKKIIRESINESKSIKEGTFHWSDNKAAYEAIKVKNALKKAFNTHVFQDDSQNLYIPFNFWGRKDAEKAGVTIDTVGKFLNSIGYKYTGKSEDDEDVYNYLKDDVKIELYEVNSNRYAIHLDFDSEVDDKLDIDTTSFSSYVNTDDVDAVQDLLLDIVEGRVKTLGDIVISEEDIKNIKELCGRTLDMYTYDFAGYSDDIVDKIDDYFAMKQYQELHNKHVDESKSIKESGISEVEPVVKFKGKSSHTFTPDKKWEVDFDEEGNVLARTRQGKPYYFSGHINDKTNEFGHTDEDAIIQAAREQHKLKFGKLTSRKNESKSIKESTTGDYVEVAYICDGLTNFHVYGGGFKTSDALVAVKDEKGKRLRLTMGDVCEFYTWYDAKGNVIHEPTYYSED